MTSTITIDFNASLARFTSQIDKATNDLNKFQSNTARIADNVKSVFGILGAGFAIAGIASSVREVADLADEMGKAAQKVGTTTESLSALKYAGDLANVSFEELQVGLGKLAKNAEDFRAGSKSAIDAFGKIGIDPTKFKDTTQLFEAVAERISKLDDGARKTAISMELFGKSGKELIPLLNGGAQAMRDAAEEAKRLGIIISTDASNSAQEFKDNLTRIGQSLNGIKIALASGIIGDLASLTTQFLDAAQAADGFWGAISGVNTNKNTLNTDLAEAESRLKKLKSLRNELDPSKGFANQLNEAIFGDVKTLDAQIKVAQQEYNTLFKMKELADKRLNNKPTSGGSQPNDIKTNQHPRVAIDKDAEAAKRFIESLTKESETLGFTKTQLEAYEAAHLKLKPAQKAIVDDLLKKIDAYNEEEKRLKALDEAYQNHEKVMEDFNNRELQQIEDQSAADAARTDDLEKQAKSIREMLDPTIKLYDELAKVQELGNLGILDPEEVAAASQKIQDEFDALSGKAGKTADDVTEFWKQAAHNMQDAMSDFFFGAMQGDLSNLAGDFKKTIDRMVANILAARAATSIFGADFASGKSDVVGGLAGKLFGGVGDFFKGLFNANGNAFDQSGLIPFANGGVFGTATPFSFGGGKLGVLGERGPEAILPLKRGANGQLGIQASGGGSATIIMNIQTPDANSFRKSQPQMMAEMQRNLNRGRRIV